MRQRGVLHMVLVSWAWDFWLTGRVMTATAHRTVPLAQDFLVRVSFWMSGEMMRTPARRLRKAQEPLAWGSCVTGREMISTRALCTARDLVLPAGAGCSLITGELTEIISRGGVADFREKSGAYQTCSQGFGQGFRGFAAGGIGILYNGEGDDIYEGSYFCQGSSYWLSIGMLIDNKGNDTYQARRYSEGAGVHSSIGALLDREGNDSYTSWAVSQGCGHDRSIGMLWDSQGNDRYSAEWLSQGSGNDAGRGILIDEQGDDTYAAGTQGTQGCGIFDVRRDEMSIGILVDGSGSDTFKGNGKSNNVWTCGEIGGGIDAEGRMPAVWR